MAEDNPEGMAAAEVSPLSPHHGGTVTPWGQGGLAPLRGQAAFPWQPDQAAALLRGQAAFLWRLALDFWGDFHGNRTRQNSHLPVATWLGLRLCFHSNCSRPGPVLCTARLGCVSVAIGPGRSPTARSGFVSMAIGPGPSPTARSGCILGQQHQARTPKTALSLPPGGGAGPPHRCHPSGGAGGGQFGAGGGCGPPVPMPACLHVCTASIYCYMQKKEPD